MHGICKNPIDMIKIHLFPKWIVPMLVSFTLLFSGDIFGKNEQQSIFDMMYYKEVLDVTLEADINYLKNNRRDEALHKARLSFRDVKGQKQAWDIKVKLRGAFRRIHCEEMPPLKLNFKKSELRAAGLADFDDLKLVPYCVENEELAQDILFREYLIYKMFNAVSDYSFRVQLLRISYKDSSTGAFYQQWAFLIEDTAQLKERTGMKQVDETKVFNLPPERFDREYLKTVSVFQYMVGNFDWSIANAKNLKFLEKNGKIFAVPYDFDFTGLVNAPYLAIDSGYGIKSRHQRIYLGFPEDVPDLHSATHSVAGKRLLLENIIKNFKPLNLVSRKDILAYLAAYFDNPDVVKVAERIAVEATESP